MDYPAPGKEDTNINIYNENIFISIKEIYAVLEHNVLLVLMGL